MTFGLREYIEAVDRIDAARAAGECGNILGYYMEGPYLNPAYGASKEDYAWSDEILPEEYGELVRRVRGSAKVWALAPEREGIETFVQDVRRESGGVVFSVAHSTATPQQIAALLPYGLKLATHHTNATARCKNTPNAARPAWTRPCSIIRISMPS